MVQLTGTPTVAELLPLVPHEIVTVGGLNAPSVNSPVFVPAVTVI